MKQIGYPFVKKYQDQIQAHFDGLENDYKEEVAEDVMISQDIKILKSSKGGFSSWEKVYNKYFTSPVDFRLMFKFLRRAADEEIAESFSPLANMYYDETDYNEKIGIPVDYEEAAKLILRGQKNFWQRKRYHYRHYVSKHIHQWICPKAMMLKKENTYLKNVKINVKNQDAQQLYHM
jgi:hypothetical protein